MKKILFLAPYPDSKNEKDGMYSRIKSIDAFFQNDERKYLSIKFFKKGSSRKIDNVQIFRLNLFLNIFLIIRLFAQSDIIYCHSIYSVRFLWPIILCFNKLVVLDIHGVVPEEERYFYNHKLFSYYYRFVEFLMFHKISMAICVTKKMEDVYRSRYKKSNCKFIIYSIIPFELYNHLSDSIWDQKGTVTQIIYSGGVQKWQNVTLMLNAIKKKCTPSIHYTILTGNVQYVRKIADELCIPDEYLTITSCAPNELGKFYNQAHYAFILRDDSIVNIVANPTKLIEYLFWGLVPVVLSPSIGDYESFGYEYVSLENFMNDGTHLFPRKSLKNREIALDIIASNKNVDLRSLIMGL